jgi:hypothetical protein
MDKSEKMSVKWLSKLQNRSWWWRSEADMVVVVIGGIFGGGGVGVGGGTRMRTVVVAGWFFADLVVVVGGDAGCGGGLCGRNIIGKDNSFGFDKITLIFCWSNGKINPVYVVCKESCVTISFLLIF